MTTIGKSLQQEQNITNGACDIDCNVLKNTYAGLSELEGEASGILLIIFIIVHSIYALIFIRLSF